MKPRWAVRLLLVCALLLPSALFYAQPKSLHVQTPAAAAPSLVKYSPAPVVIDGRVVVEVQWGIGSITPQVRASAISERLVRIARNNLQGTDLTARPGELRIDITEGDLVVASVFAGDAEAAGVSQEVLATEWQTAFTQAINSYRAEHSHGRMLERIGFTLLVVLVTLAALWLLVPLTRWASVLLSREVTARLSRARTKSWSLIDAR